MLRFVCAHLLIGTSCVGFCGTIFVFKCELLYYELCVESFRSEHLADSKRFAYYGWLENKPVYVMDFSQNSAIQKVQIVNVRYKEKGGCRQYTDVIHTTI